MHIYEQQRFNTLKIHNSLKKLNTYPEQKISIPAMLKKELQIWANIITEKKDGRPIPSSIEIPPTTSINFISNAAGRHSTIGRKKKNRCRIIKCDFFYILTLGA